MKRDYELVVILDPEIKAEAKEKLLAKIQKTVTDSEGKILELKEWGKKELAYPIAKKHEGILYWFSLTLPSEKVKSIKQKIKLEELVLRFLLVNKERRPA